MLFGIIIDDDHSVCVYKCYTVHAKRYYHKEYKAMKFCKHYLIILQGVQKKLKQTLGIDKNFCET